MGWTEGEGKAGDGEKGLNLYPLNYEGKQLSAKTCRKV